LIAIAATRASDLPLIESLLDAGFGPARHKRTAYRLRDGVAADPGLSFVAHATGAAGAGLLGSVQCWPLALRSVSGAVLPLVLLGPVVTAAAAQGRGIATALIDKALAAADAAGAPPILLIGDAGFYGRFGFTSAATGDWLVPGPVDRARLLLRGGNAALPRLGWLEPAVSVRRSA
jgi:predicted N-acetyltransferase YhbS